MGIRDKFQQTKELGELLLWQKNPPPLYRQKRENYQKALNRQEADYVPNIIMNNGGGFFWSGKTAFDVAGDHIVNALEKC